MSVLEQIIRDVQELPELAQAEVLDFVQFLKGKTAAEDADWSAMSLAQAMRGMEAEPDLYSEGNIKEHFE